MNAFKECQLPDLKVAKLEANAYFYWDKFYKFHADRFFQDRHWFSAEFPALLTANAVLEVGCGVGNTIFPLLEINPTAHVYACDFAATAINIVHQHPEYESSKRVTAFVADLIADDLLHHVPRGIVDACTMIFVLSAISPEAMPAAVANIKQTLRRGGGSSGGGGGGEHNSNGIYKGGQILFRDYAAGDLAQERLQRDTKQQRIGEGFYMRGDGTRAYYFTENFVLDLFKQQGFRCEELVVKEMEKVNRNTGVSMGRKFIHGVFTLIEEDEDEEEDGNKKLKSNGSGGDAWVPFKSPISKDSIEKSSSSSVEEPLIIEHQLVEEKKEVELEIVQLGNNNNAMTLHLENFLYDEVDKLEERKNVDNSINTCASKTLAEIVIRCPILFHDINIVQVRCGGNGNGNGGGSCSGGLPLFAALRWCRRALGVDDRREALEVFRSNAVRNGWQFAYEKLRVAIEPKVEGGRRGSGGGEKQSWVSAAFRGPIGGVLACIGNQNSVIILEQVLSSAAKILKRGQGGFLLLVGPKKVMPGLAQGDEVDLAAQAGFKVRELPPEVLQAMEDVDIAESSVMFLQKE